MANVFVHVIVGLVGISPPAKLKREFVFSECLEFVIYVVFQYLMRLYSVDR